MRFFPLICLVVSLSSFGVSAAVPVEDMSTRDVRSDSGSPITTPQPVLPDELTVQPGALEPAGGGAAGVPQTAPQVQTAVQPGQNAQLFYELQQLQTEMLQLRGLVEDQAYEIKRLRDLQRSQYLDIDRRLVGVGAAGSGNPQTSVAVADTRALEVQTGAPSATVEPVAEVPVPVAEVPVPVADVPVDVPGDVQNQQAPAAFVTASERAPTEQDAYESAFGLMKDQQFEQSIEAYQSVIENFPDGTYVPESRYWLGELYLMSDRLEDARGSFTHVVDRFPAHQKVPLSLYKLGVVNHRLGGTPKALEYLDDVVVRYPDTPAAGLARTYAAELR